MSEQYQAMQVYLTKEDYGKFNEGFEQVLGLKEVADIHETEFKHINVCGFEVDKVENNLVWVTKRIG